MSWYFNYYLGYKKDDKIHFLGLYDDKGALHPVLSKSRSFASEIYNHFCELPDDKMGDNVLAWCKAVGFDPEYDVKLQYAHLMDLPQGDFVKRGYFLFDEVAKYIEPDNEYYQDPDVFTKSLSIEEFGFKVQAERNAPSQPAGKKRGDRPSSDYVYFCYRDVDSEEYESWLIRMAARAFDDHDDVEYDMSNVVVILSQG